MLPTELRKRVRIRASYYVWFFIHLDSRRVNVAGITRHPDQEWMEQIARSATQETWGFRSVLAAGGVKAIPLPVPQFSFFVAFLWSHTTHFCN